MSLSYINIVLFVICFVLFSPVSAETECDSCTCMCEKMCESGGLNDLIAENKKHDDDEQLFQVKQNNPHSSTRYGKENLKLVNKYRSEFELRKLKWCGVLARMAKKHSSDMYRHHSLHHSDYNEFENIAYSINMVRWPGTAYQFFEQWKESPRHNRNMLMDSHVFGGIGIYGDGYTFYATQLFSDTC